MNNQFVGDVGDYTKLGILRALEKADFSVGINWYKTPDDRSKTGGSHTAFLDYEGKQPDSDLLKTLREIKEKKRPRTLESLMDSTLFTRAIYYDEELNFFPGKDPKTERKRWHELALEKLQSQDIIFLDPDNAFETKHIKPHHKKGSLYAGYEEAADYYRAGKSVIVYNHLSMRSAKKKFIENRLCPILNHVSAADIFYVEANRFQVRYYLFISQPKHTNKIQMTLDEMLKMGWEQYIKKYEKL